MGETGEDAIWKHGYDDRMAKLVQYASQDDTRTDLDYKRDLMQKHLDEGNALRNEIIPWAVRWYKGEPGCAEDSDEEDVDDEDDDDDYDGDETSTTCEFPAADDGAHVDENPEARDPRITTNENVEARPRLSASTPWRQRHLIIAAQYGC